jgi:chromosome partitioning protein
MVKKNQQEKIMQRKSSIISVVNQKGGVGKTVTSVSLACCYAQLGEKVLLIDFDYQANATQQLGAEEKAQQSGKNIAKAIKDRLKLDEVVIGTDYENVDIIAGSHELQKLADGIQGTPRQFHLISSILDSEMIEEYSVVIIDTHPSIDCFFHSALTASHYYLVPVFCESESLRGLSHCFKCVEEIRDYLNPMLTCLGCVITRFDKSNSTHKMLENTVRKMGESSNFRVFNVKIPMSKAIAAASIRQEPVIHYQKSKAAPIATAYMALAGEIQPHLKGRRLGRKVTPVDVAIVGQFEETIGTELEEPLVL